MKRAYTNTVGYLIITMVIITVVAIFMLTMQSTIGVSDFSIVCATPISTKSIYYSLPPQARIGSAPILHQLCPPRSREVTPSSVNDTAFNLYQMASTCWGSLGGADLVTDEENTLPCYIGSFYTTENELTIPAKDMKTYFDSQNTTMKVIFVKYDDGTEEIEFIDMDEGVEDLPDDFQAEVLFSDWKTYSDEMVPILNIPYLRADTMWSYVTFDFREQEGNDNNQNSEVISAVTSEQVWEDSIIKLARADVFYDFILFRESEAGGEVDFPEIPGLVDDLLEFLINTFGRPFIVDILYNSDYPTEYYETLSCGHLMASMACCEDKIVICIKEP